MMALLIRRCTCVGRKLGKTAVMGSSLLMVVLYWWLQLNILVYSEDAKPRVLLPGNITRENAPYDSLHQENGTAVAALILCQPARLAIANKTVYNKCDNIGDAPSDEVIDKSTTTAQGTVKTSTPPHPASSPVSAKQPEMEAATKTVNVPGIDIYLPHLRNKPEYLQPAVKISQNRNGVQLVIGVPTIKRPKAGYLSQTLDSLLSNLPPEDSTQCIIIVFIAEPWDMTYVNNLVADLHTQYSEHMLSGLLEVIAPRPEFYPNLDNLPITLDDNKDRVKWRSKQNLDYVYLMLQAQNKGQFYIQLEDDVITKPNYFKQIMIAIANRKQQWFMLKFSPLGFIGKLVRASNLPFIAEFLLMFYSDKPGDWLIDNLVSTKVCGKNMSWKECTIQTNKVAIAVRPSLFQHIGTHSSLKGKLQLLKDKTFYLKGGINPMKDVVVERNNNPTPTNIETTIDHYSTHKIEFAYVGSGYFWGLTPLKDDIIDFIYDPPIKIAKYKLVSGHNKQSSEKKLDFNNKYSLIKYILENKNDTNLLKYKPDSSKDVFPEDTTIEILIINNTSVPQTKFLVPEMFQKVGHFNDQGVAEGDLHASLGPVGVFRIHVNSNMTTWVILSTISITLA